MDYTYYPQTVSLYRSDYKTRREYIEAYRDYCKHYGYKARVEGGWQFFVFASDLDTWKNQR